MSRGREMFARALVDAFEHAADQPPPRSKLYPDIEVERLRAAFASFNTKHEFRPGMIVRPKCGLSITKVYGDNNLAVVMAVLDDPVLGGDDDWGSPAFRIPLDMQIASLEHVEDREFFLIFHVQSSRYEPVPEAELALITGPVSAIDEPQPERAGPPTPRSAA